MRRKVRSIDFEGRADGALDGPPHVHPEAHVHVEAWNKAEQPPMPGVVFNLLVGMNLRNALDEAHNRHICSFFWPFN